MQPLSCDRREKRRGQGKRSRNRKRVEEVSTAGLALLVHLLDLGGLALDLTGASERAVDFT
jgi:ABC-type transporter Mla MlaB component